MTAESLGLLALYLTVALLCVKPLGRYLAHVMEGRPLWPVRAGRKPEGLIYRLCGVDPAVEMGCKHYACALLVFNTLGALLAYALQRLQGVLPLNPQHFPGVSPDSSFNPRRVRAALRRDAGRGCLRRSGHGSLLDADLRHRRAHDRPCSSSASLSMR